MNQLKNNIVVIGGSGDIGSSICKLFETDYNVTCTSRKQLDLSSSESITKFLSSNLPIFTHIIFCAAENEPSRFMDLKISNFERTLKINFISITEIIQAMMRSGKLKTGGAVVVVSSLYGLFGRSKRLSYSVSKHALNALVKNLAIELSSDKIRVNSVTPGFIDTKLTRKNLNEANISAITGSIPLKTLGHPSDIAHAVYFLTSDNSRYIYGQDIIVDGGYICGSFMGIE